MDKLKVENNSCGDIIFENSEYIFNYDTQNSTHFISLTMPLRKMVE